MNQFLTFLMSAFQVLSLHETLAAYGSVHYVGTILPIVVIFLGSIIKPARAPRPAAQKKEQ